MISDAECNGNPFQSQVDTARAAMENLLNRKLNRLVFETSVVIQARFLEQSAKQLEKFDGLVKQALEEKELRYEERKGRKPKPGLPTSSRLWSELRNPLPPAPTRTHSPLLTTS